MSGTTTMYSVWFDWWHKSVSEWVLQLQCTQYGLTGDINQLVNEWYNYNVLSMVCMNIFFSTVHRGICI